MNLFGTLPNFVEWDAAFLLSDGSWLKRGYGKNSIEHRNMAQAIYEYKCRKDCLTKFINETGAIRITQSMRTGRHGIDIIYSSKTPTAEQIEKLHELCGPSGQPLSGWGRCFGHVYCEKMSDVPSGKPWEPGVMKGRSFHFDGGLKEIADAMERCKVEW